MSNSNKFKGFILIFIIVLICYSNTFHVPWHFDDDINIVKNPHIHLSDLSFKSIKQSFFASYGKGAYKGDKLYRPVSCMTLALNWYAGQDNVFGYHLVNILIHCFTACILFQTLLALFCTPRFKFEDQKNTYTVTLLAAMFWAVNPMQTQAVTYIVQRMAALGAMFYILGIYFYIKTRLALSRPKRFMFLTGCALSFFLAMASKENTITFPGALVLVELVFFQNIQNAKVRKRILWVSILSGILILFSGVCLISIMEKDPAARILELYERRSFTPMERILTQPRVVVFYLSQLFYPVPIRMSLIHNFEFSTSLFTPWTTFPAILLILGLIIFGMFQIKKRPMLSFSILFFFLAHSIESTILPLEIAFEHRNYLPSLFLFVPAAQGLNWLINYYKTQKSGMYVILVCFITFLIMGLGTGTYVRNMAWSSVRSLWEDINLKYPNLSRPYQFIAGDLNEKGNRAKAIELYEKSLDPSLKSQNANYSRMVSLNSLGTLYAQEKQYEKAISLFRQALDAYETRLIQQNIILVYIDAGKWDKAANFIDSLLSEKKGYDQDDFYLNMKGVFLARNQQPEKALEYFKKAFYIDSSNRVSLFNMGITFTLTGQYDQGRHFIQQANQLLPDVLPMLWLIENRLRAEDFQNADVYIDYLLARYSVESIKNQLKMQHKDNHLIPLPLEGISNAIVKKLAEKSQEIQEINKTDHGRI